MRACKRLTSKAFTNGVQQACLRQQQTCVGCFFNVHLVRVQVQLLRSRVEATFDLRGVMRTAWC